LDEEGTGRRLQRESRRASAVCAWGGVDGEVLTTAVAAVAGSGGALRLGYTRDGSAYTVGIYGDGAPYTDYIRADEGIEDYLVWLAKAWIETYPTAPPDGKPRLMRDDRRPRTER
jgi:hypothetical protein